MHQSMSYLECVRMACKIYKRIKILVVDDPISILEVVVEVVDVLIINMC
jgi:ATP-dependent Clp protease adapter protein ClpS